MKKITSVIVMFLLLFMLSACSGGSGAGNNGGTNSSTEDVNPETNPDDTDDEDIDDPADPADPDDPVIYSDADLAGPWIIYDGSDYRGILITDGAGAVTFWGEFGDDAETYTVEDDGSFIITDKDMSFSVEGQLTSTSTGTWAGDIDGQSSSGEIKKVEDRSLCQGYWKDYMDEDDSNLSWQFIKYVDETGAMFVYVGLYKIHTGYMFRIDSEVTAYGATGTTYWYYDDVKTAGELTDDGFNAIYITNNKEPKTGTSTYFGPYESFWTAFYK